MHAKRDASKRDRSQPVWSKAIGGANRVGAVVLCLAGSLCTGCALAPGVIRGQSPAPAQQAAVVTTMPAGAAMPAGAIDPNYCDSDGDGRCLPKHRLWYHYAPPGRCCLGSCLNIPPCPYSAQAGPLVYPQNPTPAALVQYPYYVCKGPDDFYYQK